MSSCRKSYTSRKFRLVVLALHANAPGNDIAGFYRLSREEEGKFGHARRLLEFLCLIDSSRLCGAIWREGAGAIGVDATVGHWVGATHIHEENVPWLDHIWVFKNSIGSFSARETAEEIMEKLDSAEMRRLDFGLVVDFR